MSLNLPNASAPWVTSDGRLTPTAVRALTALWNRTGDAEGDTGDDVFAQFGSGLEQQQTSEQVVAQPAPSPNVVEMVSQPRSLEAFPVGAIVAFEVPTNPAELLGYGVWVAHGPGRMIVGFSAGDPLFGTEGATGGTRSITIDDHDHHTHGVNSTTTAVQSGAGVTVVDSVVGNTGNESPTLVHTSSGTSPIVTLPPYIVEYRWKRTA